MSGAASVSVPGLGGRTAAEATALAKHDGLTLRVSGHQASPVPSGVVVSQSPGSGSFTSGRSVHVVLSSGPAPVSVPAMVGQAWTKVKPQLDNVGFSYGNPTAAYSNTFVFGAVISVKPGAGTLVSPDGRSRSCCRRAARRCRFPT